MNNDSLIRDLLKVTNTTINRAIIVVGMPVLDAGSGRTDQGEHACHA